MGDNPRRPLCVECLSPAAIQVSSPDGMPMGTYCQPCWDEIQRLHETTMAFLEDGLRKLDTQEAHHG